MGDDVDVNEQESAAAPLPPPSTELMFGAGQSAWLAVVTVGVLVALAVSFVALFLAMNNDNTAAPAPSGPQTSVTFDASEFAFDPADATIAADADVSVTLDNVGSVEHNWTVLQAGTTIDDETQYDPSLDVTSLTAQAGASDSGTVNLAPGTYQFICTVPGHFSAGMHGTLEVTS